MNYTSISDKEKSYFEKKKEVKQETEIRIGQSLNLREDLYAWAFISLMNREYIALTIRNIAYENDLKHIQ